MGHLKSERRDIITPTQVSENRLSDQNQALCGQNGQYFTPDHVCELMAKMTIPEIQDGQSVCDPACGSGRMLIKATEVNRYGQFYGVDIDRRCTNTFFDAFVLKPKPIIGKPNNLITATELITRK